MNEQEIARRLIKRLQDTQQRAVPALRVNGTVYTPEQLAALDTAALWGDDTRAYINSFLDSVQRNRSAEPPRHAVAIRGNPEGVYPDDLCILEAAGWKVLEVQVAYPVEIKPIRW